MKILLLGYGKMGKTIETLAQDKGHEIVGRIDADNAGDLSNHNPQNTDVVIEFSQPTVAFDNIIQCLNQDLPVVSGTTGWLEKIDEVKTLCAQRDGAFFYSSNYSIGVNIFFKLNEWLAKVMNRYSEYTPAMTEIHHIHKKDAPSGTAITLAEGLIGYHKNYIKHHLGEQTTKDSLAIKALREDEVPGTHTVNYQSEIDGIEITHEAYSRRGFAMGALVAAEWITGKKGVFTMDDLMDWKNL